MNWIFALVMYLRALLRGRLALAAENLALRQQLAVLHRSVPKPKLHDRDRRFWILSPSALVSPTNGDRLSQTI